MKIKVIFLALWASVAFGQTNHLNQKEKSDGWKMLFDGKSLKGWSQEEAARWRVANGVLLGEAGDGWLRSEDTFTDFLLKLDYRNSPKGNSGIFLRATKESKTPEPNPAGGYELQINNEDAKYATGSIEDVIQRIATVDPAPNQWHTFDVEVHGDHFVATLDGTKTLDGKDSRFKSGYIGLQHHKDNKVEFRNIRIKPLRVDVAAHGYHLLNVISLPGDQGWDYLGVDPPMRNLYVSHGNQVDVIDLDSGKVKGHIPNTQGVHGIAIAPQEGRGFTTNGTPGSVTIFDRQTLATIEEVPTGKNPNCVMYDSATHRIFTVDRGSERLTAFDAATGKQVGTIEKAGGKLEFGAADGAGHLFVNLEDKNALLKLDSKKLSILERWPTDPCTDPVGMVMDRKNNRVFIGCRGGSMAVVNGESGKVITTLPIGKGVDATVFDPETALIFNSSGDGTMTIVHEDSPDSYRVVETVKTQAGARTMALDPVTHNVYLAVAEFEPAQESVSGGPPTRRKVKAGSFRVLVFGNSR